MKGAADRHDAQSSQAPGIERDVRAMRTRSGKWQLDDSPFWRRDKALTVGLPGTRQFRSAEVQAIFLTIAQHVDCNPRKARCVHVAAIRGEIQTDLMKPPLFSS